MTSNNLNAIKRKNFCRRLLRMWGNLSLYNLLNNQTISNKRPISS